LRYRCEGKSRDDFWQLVITAAITLINSDEVLSSDVSPEEAAGFLAAPQSVPPPAAPSESIVSADDNLFDMAD